MTRTFVEQDCTISHEGKTFSAMGCVISDERLNAYLGKDGLLTDWHGNTIGTYRIVSSWSTPRSFVSSTMHAVHAWVDHKLYKGRSTGTGMLFRGKRSA